MAATKAVHRSPSLGSGKTAVLIEEIQLVAPRRKLPVPNHLLESKIYSKVAQNSVVQARPAVLHFGGFELGKTMRQKLFIANVSSEVQRYHIVPPQSKYFNIKYTKNDRLVPGLTLDCVVEFYPDEFRYYYDCIRIHCKGDDNLVIPIHAYPVMSSAEFPSRLEFPPTPVGERRQRQLPLASHCPVDFEFSINIPQHHPAFRIDPLQGTIPAMGEVYIHVVFSPSDFSTCQTTIQVNVSQFNAKPLMCTISGRSAPGIPRELSAAVEDASRSSRVLDPGHLSPVDRARRKKVKLAVKMGDVAPERISEVDRHGLKIPVDLDTPHAVATVLNQEPGKLRVKDLRLAQKDANSRQMKEALFEQAVRQNVYEERQNQLRWQVRLGEDPIAQHDRLNVLEQRETSWHVYKHQRGDVTLGEERERTDSLKEHRRVHRDYTEVASEGQTFDLYKNDPWAVKHDVLKRFAQAARTVIVRKRADDKLGLLTGMVEDMGKRKHSVFTHSTGLIKGKEEADPAAEIETSLARDAVTSVVFPIYKSADSKDDMAPAENADLLDVAPTVVTVKHKVPYYNLKVPDQYRLYGYTPLSSDAASRSRHVAPGLARALRTGAEDELVNLPIPTTTLHEEREQETVLRDLEDETEEKVTEFVPHSEPDPASEPLNPPEALLHAPQLPALHIFNPSPGLEVYQNELIYSETDPDFNLCPLPRYHKQYTHTEDVIKGVMQWKKLPSQGLTSLSNTPTLTNVWVPRWSEGFVCELLPLEAPHPLMDKLPDDEVIMDDDDVTEDHVTLTPEMVNAQFAMIEADENGASPESEKPKEKDGDLAFPHGPRLPATNLPVSSQGHVTRDVRERDLDTFLNKKYNRLGQKIHNKVHQLEQTITAKELNLD